MEPAQKGEKRKPRNAVLAALMMCFPKRLSVEVVEHYLPEDERVCRVCGSELVEIGVELHRSLQMKPALFWVWEDCNCLM